MATLDELSARVFEGVPVKLPNGSRVLDRRGLSGKPGHVPAEIVLCYIPGNQATPYATWQRNTVEYVGTYWGHYFDNLADANRDFHTR